jgi:hypothetical protein
LSIALVVAAAASPACKKDAPPQASTATTGSAGSATAGSAASSAPSERASIAVLGNQLSSEVEKRTGAAFARPAVSKATDDALGSLMADSRVSDRLATLVTKLQSDTRIAGAIQVLMTRLMDDPQVVAAVQQLMAENPGATQEQIGEMFGGMFEKRWNTPAVNEAWMEAWNAFQVRLGGGPQLAALWSAILGKLTGGIDDMVSTRRTEKRLTELNGGTMPDPAKATQLLLDNMWSTQRIDDLIVKLLGNKTARQATATLIADLLGVDAVAKSVTDQAGAVAASAKVQTKAVKALQALYVKDLKIENVRTTLMTFTTDPEIVAAIGGVLETVATSPRVAELGNAWFETVRKDPQMQADLTAFFTTW